MLRRLALVSMTALALVAAACDTGPVEVADPVEPTPIDEPTPTPDAVPDDEALDRVASAAGATAAEGTARFAITVETEDTGVGDGTQAAGAEGEEDFAQERRRITLQGPQGDLDMIVDGSTVYFQLPATEDDDWVRVELDRLVDADIGFGGPGAMPFQSPHNNLVLLEETAVRAAEAGEETIDGAATTRYDVTLDLAAAAEETDETTGTRGELEATARQLGLDELDMSVWVDEDERIRRIVYRLDLDRLAVDDEAALDTPDAEVEADVEVTGAVSVTIDYFDFGAPVDIDLPDEDQVVDLDEDELRGSFPRG